MKITLEETKADDEEHTGRIVPMTRAMSLLLSECVKGKEKEDFVFTRENGVPVVDPRDEWQRACCASMVPDADGGTYPLGKRVERKRADGTKFQAYVGLNLHDLRRSAIRRMTDLKIPLRTQMAITGHRTDSCHRRYDIAIEADLAPAAQLIENGVPN